MKISNLDCFEVITETTDIIGGDGVAVSVDGVAIGESATTMTRTMTRVHELPFGGSVGTGVGVVIARALTRPSPTEYQ